MVEGGQGSVVAGGGMAKGQVMAGEVRGKSVEECGRVWKSVDECGRGQEQGNDGQASRQGKGQRREIKGAATKNSSLSIWICLVII